MVERFLQLGRFSCATAYAPISFPPAPVLAFKPAPPAGTAGSAGSAGSGSAGSGSGSAGAESMADASSAAVAPPPLLPLMMASGALLATGSVLAADPFRLNIKRIILTGYSGTRAVSQMQSFVESFLLSPKASKHIFPGPSIRDTICYDLQEQMCKISFSQYTLFSSHPISLSLFSSLSTPVRVHKRHAVVRFMFVSSEDVKWFKPVQLRTKHGLIGEIREPLGTKGHFKCSFNDFIKQNDTICMHLYKRQHPKWEPELWE